MASTINSDNGVVSGSSGLKSTADTSGVLALQSNGTTGLTLNTSLAIGVGSGNSTGSSGQVLTSAGSSAAPTWATPTVTSPAGSTGQVQYNNAGAFGAISSGTSGQVLTSAGSGSAPSWADLSLPGALGANSAITMAGDTYQFAASSATNANTIGGWTRSIPFITGNGSTISSMYTPKYSTYYGGWITTAVVGTTLRRIVFSKDGVNWASLGLAPTANGTQAPLDQLADGTVGVVVDDSNGLIFYAWTDSTNYQVGYFYQTTLNDFNSWTSVTAVSGTGAQTPDFNSMEYVQFSTTGNSGIVLLTKPYNNHDISVIAAGGTTVTSRATRSQTGTGYNARLVWNSASQTAIALCYSPNSPYNSFMYVTTNVNQSWSTGAATAGTFPANSYVKSSALSSQYVAYLSSGTVIRYNTTANNYTAWTFVSPGIGTIYALYHNGTYWYAYTSTGCYTTSSATPTGWTQILQNMSTTNTVGSLIQRRSV